MVQYTRLPDLHFSFSIFKIKGAANDCRYIYFCPDLNFSCMRVVSKTNENIEF